MKWNDALVLHAAFWTYLVVGGGVFYLIERPHRNGDAADAPPESTPTADWCLQMVRNGLADQDGPDVERLIDETCRTDAPTPASASATVWDFSSALFMAMTIVTTIGYGNDWPSSTASKLFMIGYALLGIPLAGLTLASTSDYLSSHLLTLYRRQRRSRGGDAPAAAVAVAAAAFLVPGLALLLFAPAAVFAAVESWSYVDAFYYSFVTLTTIGFGDLVAALDASQPWLGLYRVLVIVWIVVGISYWAVIIAFITKALKSKKLKQQWMATMESIASQVDDLRQNMAPHDEFVANRSKNAFQFAMQMAGSVGQLGNEAEQELMVPGIASALRTSASGGGPGIRPLLAMLVRTVSTEEAGQAPKLPDADERVEMETVERSSPVAAPSSSDEDQLKNLLVQATLLLQECDANGVVLPDDCEERL